MKVPSGGVILVVGFLVLGWIGTGIAAAEQPAISLSVNGETVSHEEVVRVTENPEVGVTIEADAQIQTVQFHVNGDIEESFSPSNKSFSRTTDFDLKEGHNDVKIVAKAVSVSTFSTTITKDNTRPMVAYSAPFETSRFEGAPDEVTVADGTVTFAGTLSDTTGVKKIAVERRYYYSSASSGTSRVTHTIDEPGESFSHDILLGAGENQVKLTYTDEMGNVGQDSITVTVEDESAPSLDFSVPEVTSMSTLQFRGTVSDNVKVNSVHIEKPDGGTIIPVRETDSSPQEERLSVPIEEGLELYDGKNTIIVKATDVAGNTVERQYTVEYDPDVEPRISIDHDPIQPESETVTVRGRVDRALVSMVSIETVDVKSGDIVDIAEVYKADGTARVDFNETVSIADGETRVRVRVRTARGEEYKKSITVSPPEGSADPADKKTSPTTTTETEPTDTSHIEQPPQQTESFTPGFGAVTVGLALILVAAQLGLRD